ncbi:hypothetical protein [Lacticaseibacillus sp. GG6-2]
MHKNDEMQQMFSRQGLLAGYVYLVVGLAVLTGYRALSGHYDPVLTGLWGSSALVAIGATQVLQWHRLGKSARTTASVGLVVLCGVVLGLMAVVYGLGALG